MNKCPHCKKDITEKDKFVVLKTQKGNKVLEEVYYHFKCWKDYFKQSVANKVEEMSNQIMKGVKKRLPKEYQNDFYDELDEFKKP